MFAYTTPVVSPLPDSIMISCVFLQYSILLRILIGC